MNTNQKTILKITLFILFLSSVIGVAYYMLRSSEKNIIANARNLEQIADHLLKDRTERELLLELLAINRPLNDKTGAYEVLPGTFILSSDFVPMATMEGNPVVDQMKTRALLDEMRKLYSKENRIPPAFVADLSQAGKLNFAMMELPSTSAVYSVFQSGQYHRNLPMLVSFFGCSFLQAYSAQGMIFLDSRIIELFSNKEFLAHWNDGSIAGSCLPLDYEDGKTYPVNTTPLKVAPDVAVAIQNHPRRDPSAIIKRLWEAGYDLFPISENTMLWSGIVYEYFERALKDGTISRKELEQRVRRIIRFKISSGAIRNLVEKNSNRGSTLDRILWQTRQSYYDTARETRERMLMNIPDLRSINKYIGKNALALIKTNSSDKLPFKAEDSELIFTDLPGEAFPRRFRKSIRPFLAARECEKCILIDSHRTPNVIRRNVQTVFTKGLIMTPFPEKFIGKTKAAIMGTFVSEAFHTMTVVEFLQGNINVRAIDWP